MVGGPSLNGDRTRLGAGRFHGVGGAKVGGASVHSGRWTRSGRPASRSLGRTSVSEGPGWVAMALSEAAPRSDPGASSAVGRNRGS